MKTWTMANKTNEILREEYEKQQALYKRNQEIAIETLNAIGNGHYYVGSKKVNIRKDVADSIEQTTFYSSYKRSRRDNKSTVYMPHIAMISPLDVVSVCNSLPADIFKIGCLNFASAIKPGGGFINGKVAQEEAIVRSSTLYPNLTKFYKEFYSNTKEHIYSDRMIVAPNVPFIKTNSGSDLSDPHKITVITCAAPNVSKLKSYNEQEIRKIFIKRIDNVLQAFLDQGVQVPVLGAWGCGVFKNDPKLVAECFKHVISKKFHNKFKRIYFAIPDTNMGKIFTKTLYGNK